MTAAARRRQPGPRPPRSRSCGASWPKTTSGWSPSAHASWCSSGCSNACRTGRWCENTGIAEGGNRVARIEVEGGGEVTLSVDDRGCADLLMDRCELAQLDSPSGVVAGCDAETELGRRFHDAWRESGLEVNADDVGDDELRERAMGAGS